LTRKIINEKKREAGIVNNKGLKTLVEKSFSKTTL
tara:strand:- start:60417 stop:60521 length:105 start_codon:yes stop_codon:yes gene_type:complete